MKHAQADRTGGQTGLTTAEREEFGRLRQENCVLLEEREILKIDRPSVGLLHHSDEGRTYASEDYQTILEAPSLVCSMSRRGNCYDNAVIESFFSIVKSELGEHFDSDCAAKIASFDYIEVFYNQRRRPSTLG